MRKVLLLFIFIIQSFAVSLTNLDINRALEIVKEDNYEVNIAMYEEKMKALDLDIAKGYSYGKLDFSQNIVDSNDPGNVFGFKLQSREATFNDFGFGYFIDGMSGLMNPATYTATKSDLLKHTPKELNEPDSRTHYQSTLTYELPLYTGGKLTEYRNISRKLYEISKLDRQKTVNEKLYQTKKSFYDITLLNSYIKNLGVIKKSIERLEDMVKNMIQEGYAKNVDLLEVEAKRFDIERMLYSAKSNKKLALNFLSFLLNKEVASIKEVKARAHCTLTTEEEIIKENIDLQKAAEGFEITKQNIKLQRSAYLPKVGAFAQYGYANDEFYEEFSDHDYYTVGVGLSLNLFNGGIDSANLEKAKVENLKVAAQLEMAKKGVALKISQTLTEIENLDYEIELLEKELELTREVYKNYQGRYAENLVSINDVLIKQAGEIEKLLQLQRKENHRNDKVFLLEKIANKGDK